MAKTRCCRCAQFARTLAAAALALTAGWGHAQGAAPGNATELKMSVAVGPAYALGKAGEQWAKRIGERSGGKLTATLFPGATLAGRDPAQELAALRDGAADLAIGSTLFWSVQVEALSVVGLPWLAAEPKALAALVSRPVADALLTAVERAGVVPLAMAPLGYRELATTDRPIRTPADLAGLRVRVTPLPAILDLYAALDAKPRAMPFAAADAEFAAGTLDAQEGMPATLANARVYALGLKRVALWNAMAEAAVFAVNRKRWEAWTDAERAVVRDSALEAATELADAARAGNDAALVALRKGGMAVTRLTPAERAAFVAATRGAYDKWAKIAGEELVRAAEAAVKAAAP